MYCYPLRPALELVTLALQSVTSKRSGQYYIHSDFSPDVDDVGALAVLHALADKGEVNILAMMTSMYDPYAAGAMDVINTYYGRDSIPIGAYKGNHMSNCSDSTWCPYSGVLTREFESDIKRREQVPDAEKLYRQILSAQPDQSVTIATVGFLSNLDALLKTGSDEHSNLTGRELVAKKVKLLVVQGSGYPTGQTYNMSHGGAGMFAKPVIDNWPGKIVFSVDALGNAIMTGAGLKDTPSSNPVRRAYEIWLSSPRSTSQNRPSWDQTVVLHAVRRGSHDVWEEVGPFANTMSADGANRFENASNGNHYYLKKRKSDQEIRAIIEGLMLQPPKR